MTGTIAMRMPRVMGAHGWKNPAGACTASFGAAVGTKSYLIHGRRVAPFASSPAFATFRLVSAWPGPRVAPQIEMVLVPGGSFLMGSPGNEPGRVSDEGPQHRVTAPSFYIGRYVVTQAQWRAVIGNNPSRFSGDNLPVEDVSWNDAKEF